MNWNLYHNSIVMDPKKIRYDIYSFIKIVSSYFDITPFHEQCIITRFSQTWVLHQDLYSKTKYEDVVLGILVFTNEFDCKNDPIDIGPFLNMMYCAAEYKTHAISVHKVVMTLRTITGNEL